MSYQLIDPDSRLDFQFNWTDWLESSSPAQVIDTRQWSIAPLNGTSPETPALTNDTTATVTVRGMQAGKVYRLTEHITTTAGLEDDRTIVLRCDNR